MPDTPPPPDPGPKSRQRRIGRTFAVLAIVVFVFVVAIAVLQATLDTPKKGEDGVPATRDGAAAGAPARGR